MADADMYIAKEDLFIGRARAHNKGDVVPAENVEPNGWDDKVQRVKATTEPTVAQVLLEVGDDPTKAAAALESEQAKGDRARSTLVEKLEAIANPPA